MGKEIPQNEGQEDGEHSAIMPEEQRLTVLKPTQRQLLD